MNEAEKIEPSDATKRMASILGCKWIRKPKWLRSLSKDGEGLDDQQG